MGWLRSGDSALQSDDFWLRGDAAGLRSDDFWLRSDAAGLRGDTAKLQSGDFWLRSGIVALQSNDSGLQSGLVGLQDDCAADAADASRFVAAIPDSGRFRRASIPKPPTTVRSKRLFQKNGRPARRTHRSVNRRAGPFLPSRRKKIICHLHPPLRRQARAGRKTSPPCDQGRGGKDGESCWRSHRGFVIQSRPALSRPTWPGLRTLSFRIPGQPPFLLS